MWVVEGLKDTLEWLMCGEKEKNKKKWLIFLMGLVGDLKACVGKSMLMERGRVTKNLLQEADAWGRRTLKNSTKQLYVGGEREQNTYEDDGMW